MISLLGATISASSPWLLIGIPCALSLLVYIFRSRGTTRRVVVSSLLFLKSLPQRPVGRKVFLPPLQFWLELAIFTLLILATAGLFLAHSGKHVAIVIDSSKSMGALYASGGTRLDQAKRTATIDIGRARDASVYSILAATTELSRIGDSGQPATEATVAIESVSQSYRRDILSDHISALLADTSYDAVWVYTDHEISTPLSPRLRITSLPIDVSTQTNAWIKSISQEQSNDPLSLTVSVGYAGATAREALVSGVCFSDSPSSQEALSPKTVRLSPKGNALTTLTSTGRSSNYCKVSIRLQDASLFDTLPLDNDGWLTTATTNQTVRLESTLSPKELGLLQISTLSVEPASSADGSASGQSIPTIFHRLSPTAAPTTPSLVVLPPQGTLPWGGEALERKTTSQEITRWDEKHPILTYVKPALLSLPDSRPLACPDSATPIIYSTAGPIACAGETQGTRYVITGFELFPFDGGKAPTMSILTLNIFKWLFHSPLDGGAATLPSHLPVPDTSADASYIQPSEQRLTRNGTTISPQAPGILKIASSATPARYIALNSFDDYESDLSTTNPISLATPTQASPLTAPSRSHYPLLPWLVGIALTVIAADILRRLLRRAQWGDT